MRGLRKTSTFCIVAPIFIFLFVVGGGNKHVSSAMPVGQMRRQPETQVAHPCATTSVDHTSMGYCALIGISSGVGGGLVLIGGVLIFLAYKKESIKSFISSAKNDDSERKKRLLRRQSEETREERQTLATVLTPLKEVKKGLMNQRDQLKRLLEEIEKERQENKEKVRLVEIEITASENNNATERTQGYLREKQNLLNAQWKLETRKEEMEKQQLDMDRLLQKIESVMTTTEERKRKVENRRQAIHSQLEDLESEDERAHLHTV